MAFSINMCCAWFLDYRVSGASSAGGVWAGRGPPNGPRRPLKVLKKTLLNSSACNSSAWREDGKKGCPLQGQPELSRRRGKEAKKSYCFYLFKWISFQIAAGLFAGCWFSTWVCWFQGTSACAGGGGGVGFGCFFLILESVWKVLLIQSAGIVRELSVHQRTFCGEGTLHPLKCLRRSQSESLPSVSLRSPIVCHVCAQHPWLCLTPILGFSRNKQ